ncbi:MAG: aminoacyl-tRNA hydrolase [Rhabdochlamydiaceae bacterium]|nr:aminoacyl-tRNA hydrolase [Candidatus Amphrikana amoebophyrae]
MENENVAIIIGLGNPGSQYDFTRHNIGFEVVDKIADNISVSFKNERLLKAKVACTFFGPKRLILIKPSTYMNESGKTVAAAMNFYKCPLKNLMIVSDDVELPVGKLRLRENGGTGGHNGLKNIRDRLNTNEYARLKIGVGKDISKDLADYVLAKFSREELEEIVEVVSIAATTLCDWVDHGFKAASLKLIALVNAQKNNHPHGEINSELTNGK